MAVITVDPSTWTQKEKNLTQAIVVYMLYQNGITYDNVSVALPDITINNPSGDTSFLTTSSIKTALEQQIALSEQKAAEAAIEEAAKKTEIESNELTEIKLADVDTKIDAITDLASAKVFLKKMCRYIIARGI